MNTIDNLGKIFNTYNKDPQSSVFYPEPSFLIKITPNLNNVAGSEGQKVFINGISQAITQTQIYISENQHVTSLVSNDHVVTQFEGIFVEDLECSNFIYEEHGSANLNLRINNFTAIDFSPQISILYDTTFDLASPFLDLFQSKFICSISMFDQSNATNGNFIPLFTGLIGKINYDYNRNGLSVNISIDSFLDVLNNSANIQTASDQQFGTITLNTLTSQQYVFNDLLTKLINETILKEYNPSILYYKAPKETEAIGDSGTAIGTNSKVFVFTSPMEMKLTLILQTLYPYQRVFYVDNNGDLIITPLQTYFNDISDWAFTFNNEKNLIPGASIRISKNTASIKNRSVLSLLSIFNLFNPTGSTVGNSPAISVATPNKTYFPRLHNFVNTSESLQTIFATQELNASILQNSGLLNMAQFIASSVTGLSNKGVIINNNLSAITAPDADNKNLSYFLNLYTAKALAESLADDTVITITVPTNLTYNHDTGSFRNLPLNELVKVPQVNNNSVFDGINAYHCHGYSLRYDRNEGAMTKLFLTKPYTYTALWSDDQVELMNG